MCVCSHMLFCASLSGQEWEVVSISGSAHLQGRQWVDMSGWSEGSEDKGEVCMRCEGVGGVGWGPQGSGHPISHVELSGDHRKVVISFHMWSWVGTTGKWSSHSHVELGGDHRKW